jgi:hypothetical protein
MSAPLAPWRLAFMLLTPDEQRERVRQLHRHGWQEPSLLTLTGWSRDFLLRVLAEQEHPA